MALIFCDGFDSCAAFSDITDRWDQAPSSGGFTLTGGRAGGPCLEANTSNVGPAVKHLPMAYCQPSAAAPLFAGTSVRIPSYPGATPRSILSFTNERATANIVDNSNRTVALTTLALVITSTGALQFMRQNVAIATGTAIMALNTWYRIEVRVDNIDDTGGSCEVRVNGVADISLTNADLWASGPKEISSVSFAVAGCRHDDCMIWDSTGASMNAFLGDLLIETLRPNGAGSTTQSTPLAGTAWQAVDEVAVDFDTTYTAITTVNNLDTYAYSNMVATPSVIHGVVVSTQALSPGMTPRKIKNLAKVSESTTQGPEHSVILDMTNYYRVEQDFFAAKPGGGTWTKADVDAAEFGWQVTQ